MPDKGLLSTQRQGKFLGKGMLENLLSLELELQVIQQRLVIFWTIILQKQLVGKDSMTDAVATDDLLALGRFGAGRSLCICAIGVNLFLSSHESLPVRYCYIITKQR